MSGTLMQTLSVALGMSLIFSLLSLMASSAVEMLMAWLDLRPRMLVLSLKEMLAGASEESDFADKLLKHPLNRGLREFGKSWQPPAYLPSASFAGALLDLLAPAPDDKPHDAQSLRSALGEIKNDQFRTMMLGIVDQADGKVDVVKSQLAVWFDNVQEQVRGYYSRRSRLFLIIVAIIMVLTMNLDSIRIGSALWFDPELRERVAVSAEQFQRDKIKQEQEKQETRKKEQGANPNGPTDHGQVDQRQVDLRQVDFRQAEPPPERVGSGESHSDTETTTQTDEQSEEEKNARFRSARESFTDAREEFLDLGLPIGWTRAEFTATRDWVAAVAMVLNKILGLALTVLAISLGAPFWFDILNKLANLRANTGAKPLTEDDRTAQRQPAKS